MEIKRPDFVDFILKDVHSRVLENYIKDLENRIGEAISFIEVLEYNQKYGMKIKENDYLEILSILQGDSNE